MPRTDPANPDQPDVPAEPDQPDEPDVPGPAPQPDPSGRVTMTSAMGAIVHTTPAVGARLAQQGYNYGRIRREPQRAAG